jgi:chromosome segregation ATPase
MPTISEILKNLKVNKEKIDEISKIETFLTANKNSALTILLSSENITKDLSKETTTVLTQLVENNTAVSQVTHPSKENYSQLAQMIQQKIREVHETNPNEKQSILKKLKDAGTEVEGFTKVKENFQDQKRKTQAYAQGVSALNDAAKELLKIKIQKDKDLISILQLYHLASPNILCVARYVDLIKIIAQKESISLEEKTSTVIDLIKNQIKEPGTKSTTLIDLKEIKNWLNFKSNLNKAFQKILDTTNTEQITASTSTNNVESLENNAINPTQQSSKLIKQPEEKKAKKATQDKTFLLNNESGNNLQSLPPEHVTSTSSIKEVDVTDPEFSDNTLLKKAQEIQQLQDEIKILKSRLQVQEIDQDRKKQISNTLDSLRNKHAASMEKDDTIQLLKNKLIELGKKLEQYDKAILEKEQKITESLEKIKNLTHHIDDNQSTIEQLQGRFNEINNALQKNIKELTDERKKNSEAAKKQEETITSLQKNLANQETNHTSSREKLVENIKSVQVQLEEAKEQVNSLELKKTQLQKAHQELQQQRDQLQLQKGQLDQKIFSGAEEKKELTNKIEQLVGIQKNKEQKIENLEKKISALTEELETASNAISNNKKTIESLNTTLVVENKKVYDLQCEIVCLKIKIPMLETKLTHSEEEFNYKTTVQEQKNKELEQKLNELSDKYFSFLKKTKGDLSKLNPEETKNTSKENQQDYFLTNLSEIDQEDPQDIYDKEFRFAQLERLQTEIDAAFKQLTDKSKHPATLTKNDVEPKPTTNTTENESINLDLSKSHHGSIFSSTSSNNIDNSSIYGEYIDDDPFQLDAETENPALINALTEKNNELLEIKQQLNQLQSQNEQYEKEKEQSKQELEQNKSSLTQLYSELREKESTLETLLQQQGKYKEELTESKQARQELATQFENLKLSKGKLEREFDLKQTEFGELKKHLLENRGALQQLKQQLQEKELLEKQSQQQLVQQREEIDGLKNEQEKTLQEENQNKVKKELAANEARIKTLQTEKVSLENKLATQKQNTAGLAHNLTQTQTLLQEKETEINLLQQQLKSQEEQLSTVNIKKSAVEEQLTSEQQTVLAQQDKLASLQEQHAQVQTDYTTLLTTFQKQAEQLENSRKQLQENARQLRVLDTEKELESTRLQQQLDEREKNIHTLKETLNKLQNNAEDSSSILSSKSSIIGNDNKELGEHTMSVDTAVKQEINGSPKILNYNPFRKNLHQSQNSSSSGVSSVKNIPLVNLSDKDKESVHSNSDSIKAETSFSINRNKEFYTQLITEIVTDKIQAQKEPIPYPPPLIASDFDHLNQKLIVKNIITAIDIPHTELLIPCSELDAFIENLSQVPQPDKGATKWALYSKFKNNIENSITVAVDDLVTLKKSKINGIASSLSTTILADLCTTATDTFTKPLLNNITSLLKTELDEKVATPLSVTIKQQLQSKSLNELMDAGLPHTMQATLLQEKSTDSEKTYQQLAEEISRRYAVINDKTQTALHGVFQENIQTAINRDSAFQRRLANLNLNAETLANATIADSTHSNLINGLTTDLVPEVKKNADNGTLKSIINPSSASDIDAAIAQTLTRLESENKKRSAIDALLNPIKPEEVTPTLSDQFRPILEDRLAAAGFLLNKTTHREFIEALEKLVCEQFNNMKNGMRQFFMDTPGLTVEIIQAYSQHKQHKADLLKKLINYPYNNNQSLNAQADAIMAGLAAREIANFNNKTPEGFKNYYQETLGFCQKATARMYVAMEHATSRELLDFAQEEKRQLETLQRFIHKNQFVGKKQELANRANSQHETSANLSATDRENYRIALHALDKIPAQKAAIDAQMTTLALLEEALMPCIKANNEEVTCMPIKWDSQRFYKTIKTGNSQQFAQTHQEAMQALSSKRTQGDVADNEHSNYKDSFKTHAITEFKEGKTLYEAVRVYKEGGDSSCFSYKAVHQGHRIDFSIVSENGKTKRSFFNRWNSFNEAQLIQQSTQSMLEVVQNIGETPEKKGKGILTLYTDQKGWERRLALVKAHQQLFPKQTPAMVFLRGPITYATMSQRQENKINTLVQDYVKAYHKEIEKKQVELSKGLRPMEQAPNTQNALPGNQILPEQTDTLQESIRSLRTARV